MHDVAFFILTCVCKFLLTLFVGILMKIVRGVNAGEWHSDTLDSSSTLTNEDSAMFGEANGDHRTDFIAGQSSKNHLRNTEEKPSQLSEARPASMGATAVLEMGREIILDKSQGAIPKTTRPRMLDDHSEEKGKPRYGTDRTC